VQVQPQKAFDNSFDFCHNFLMIFQSDGIIVTGKHRVKKQNVYSLTQKTFDLLLLYLSDSIQNTAITSRLRNRMETDHLLSAIYERFYANVNLQIAQISAHNGRAGIGLSRLFFVQPRK